MTKAIAVFTEDVGSDIDLIEKIKSFFVDRDDFLIFTDNILHTDTNNSALSTYYLIAYTGLLIFLEVDHYIKYKDELPSSVKIALYLEHYNGMLDRNTIKTCDIITQDNNQLKWINNYELSKTI
jgi:hypothetical protein